MLNSGVFQRGFEITGASKNPYGFPGGPGRHPWKCQAQIEVFLADDAMQPAKQLVDHKMKVIAKGMRCKLNKMFHHGSHSAINLVFFDSLR